MLAENIHTYDLLRPSNPEPPRPMTNEPVSVHVLDGEQTVLFGTGFQSGFEKLTSKLDQLDGPDVIVVEHADPDHYDALPALVDRYEDTIVAIPELDVEEMKDAVNVEVDVPLTHNEVCWDIRTIHLSGHTPGNMSFIHENSDTLFVGDSFVHANSFAAAPGNWSGAFAPIKPSLSDDNEAARDNITMLEEYDFDAALVTHGLNVLEGAKGEVETLIDDLDV